MKYEEVVRYIEDIPKFTKKHTLLHTREFMKRLGNPCQGRKVLHVAGTNGKGSVCAYMQAILLFEGKRVGFFTSPHLVKLNERIRINGKDIDDDTYCLIFEKVQQVAEELEKEGLEHPSYFEFLYGMGMLAFEESDAEYIVLETGLGGRLDATNSFEHPFLSVITSIGLDHTEILGDTIEKIAGEKAGIIKKGVPVFFDGSDERSSRVIEETAENFRKALDENKENEKRKYQSIIGPHRDDISFYINDTESIKYASQGQQRTIVLSLKMAELDILKDKIGETPILLLDDVLAELDDLRQNFLLNSIGENIQTVITSVDTLLFDEEFLKDVKIFKVDNGKIIDTL